MRTATFITFALVLLAAAPATAVVERADTVATYIGGNGRHPISGDGGRVVFDHYSGTPTDGDWDIYIWEHETGLTGITDEYPKPGLNKVAVLDVDFDGTAVAAIASGDLADTGAANYELYRWTAEADWQRLTFTSGAVPKLRLSSVAINEDGTRIAFTSKDDYTGQNPAGELQIFVWRDGAGFTQVTHGFPCGPGGANFLEDLSGDGRRILFTSRCRYGTANDDLGFDIFLWDEITGVRALTETKNGDTSALASLDRDGTIAALVSRDDLSGKGITGDRLYRWVDGRGFELLTKERTSRLAPSISADGTRIVYSAKNGQGNPAINPEGAEELFFWQQGLTALAALTDSGQTDPDFGNSQPHLSADGTRLSMVALRAFDAPADLRSGHYLIDVLSPQKARPNLLVNGSFDTGLGGWELGLDAAYSGDIDGKDNPASGSALQFNDQAGGGGAVSSISQCVPVSTGTEYVISALLRIVPGAVTGSARVGVHVYPSRNCNGSPVTPLTAASISRVDGAWIGVHGRFTATPSPASLTASAKVFLVAVKNEPGGELGVGFDYVNLRRDNKVKVLP